jgi:hypothetical protein
VLRVEKVRDLTVENAEEGRPPFMAAASGVSRTGDGEIAVAVGDDENHFWEGPIDADDRGVFTRIIPGTLSTDHHERRSQKPDLEALTILPPFERNPNGALLACGSGGSRERGSLRSRGVAYTLGSDGRLAGFPCPLDISPLHEFVERHITGELNIEGMCVWADWVVLAQRGNSIDDQGRPAQSMLLFLSLEQVIESLLTDFRIDPGELLQVRGYDLGHLTHELDREEVAVKLDFTDLDHISDDPRDRIVFTAAAEGADNTPVEGQIAGSAVGVIGPDGAVELQLPLEDPTIKLEGIDARYVAASDEIELLLVADADDADVPAPLLHATLPAS